MNRKAATVALLTSLAALIGVAATASPAELKPLQGYAIPLAIRRLSSTSASSTAIKSW